MPAATTVLCHGGVVKRVPRGSRYRLADETASGDGREFDAHCVMHRRINSFDSDHGPPPSSLLRLFHRAEVSSINTVK